MSFSGSILLTGATGFLGGYLLRDLLLEGYSVAVFARDSEAASAAGRIASRVESWSQSLGKKLPNPVVVCGQLGQARLGLDLADRLWLATHCNTVIHSAGNVGFQATVGGEPWATNVNGTQRLLDLCRSLGLEEFHHVSTAFVCGQRTGMILEDELDQGQTFHNTYEESKLEAEQRVRRCPDIHATIYRPSVIVGDSRTGYTSSYQGIYRFIELAARLAKLACRPPADVMGSERTFQPLRLPFRGDEPRNLVPVDWVSRAIVELVQRPQAHGRTYHLVSTRPVLSREIKEIAEKKLGVEGTRWAGATVLTDPTPLEQMFLDHLEEYRPYFQGDPVFDCRNTSAALPHLPAPQVDRAMLERLIRFAEADRWGRSAFRKPTRPLHEAGCAHYIEEFFPQQAHHSTLGRTAGLDILIALDIHGEGGGQWTCQWVGGELPPIQRGLDDRAEVRYATDTATFEAVVCGRQTPHEAFFARRIEIHGDLEKGLKLAVLLGEFIKECPYREEKRKEARVGVACYNSC